MLRTSCCKSGGAATASGVWALGLVVTRLVGGAVGAAADIFLRANQRARPRRSGGAGVCPPRCCGTRRGSNPDRRTAAKEDASRATAGMRDYDPAKPTVRINYIDINSCWPTAAQHAMPTGGYAWLPEPQARFDKVYQQYLQSHDAGECIHAHFNRHSTGATYEVDLAFACERCNAQGDGTGNPGVCLACADIFKRQKQYTIGPEIRGVRLEEMAPMDRDAYAAAGVDPKQQGKKLLPDMNARTGYVVSEKTLCYYQRMGLRVTKFRRAFTYSQEAFLKPFIEWCVSQRRGAKTEFEKGWYKLILNSVTFGKWLVNKRKHRNVRCFHAGNPKDKGRLLRAYNDPKYSDTQDFGDNDQLKTVSMDRSSVFLNVCIAVGANILDGGRLVLNELWHRDVYEYFGAAAEFIYTDSDSLKFAATETEGKTTLKWMQEKQSTVFDCSNYGKGHVLHSDENKKTLGCSKQERVPQLFKENGETTGFIEILMRNTGKDMEYCTRLANEMPSTITEDANVSEKFYAHLTVDDEEHKTARGVQKAVMRNQLRYDMVKNLALGELQKVEFDSHHLEARGHVIRVVKRRKQTRALANKNAQQPFIRDEQGCVVSAPRLSYFNPVGKRKQPGDASALLTKKAKLE